MPNFTQEPIFEVNRLSSRLKVDKDLDGKLSMDVSKQHNCEEQCLHTAESIADYFLLPPL